MISQSSKLSLYMIIFCCFVQGANTVFFLRNYRDFFGILKQLEGKSQLSYRYDLDYLQYYKVSAYKCSQRKVVQKILIYGKRFRYGQRKHSQVAYYWLTFKKNNTIINFRKTGYNKLTRLIKEFLWMQNVAITYCQIPQKQVNSFCTYSEFNDIPK